MVATMFLAVMLFGMPITAMQMSDHMDCPFADGCMTTLEHVQHWQSAFAAAFAEFVVVIGIVLFFVFQVAAPEILHAAVRHKKRRDPLPVPLMVRLFSRGILHRKEPSLLAMNLLISN